MKDVRYEDHHVNLLSFFLALDIEERNNKIVRKKEKFIIHVLKELKHEIKVIFFRAFLLNLKDASHFECNPFVISVVISFDNCVKDVFPELVDYFLNSLERKN